VDTHPDKDKIVRAIIRGDKPLRDIARQFKISKDSVCRYVKGKLVPQLAKAGEDEMEKNGMLLRERIEKVMERTQKLYDACDEYLRDPKDPAKYTLYPRAWEFDVQYIEIGKNGKARVAVKQMQELLGYLEKKHRIAVVSAYFKSEDPRKLLVSVSAALTKQLEALARLHGDIKDTVVINMYDTWVAVKDIIAFGTQDAPEVRKKILEELSRVENG
jgi:hypothetical protein